jgi:tRNA-specific 2-thiouridylase
MDGTKVGEHDGAYFFTIGQSRGLDINKKAYVVKLDVKKNLVIVSYEKQEPELLKNIITTQDWHWISEEYTTPLDCTTKIRYRQEPNTAKIEKNEN